MMTNSAANEVREIAEQAFLYGYPMVVGYSVMYQYAINKAGPEYKAPFNKICNSARVYTPEDKAAAAPNSDTPYSFAWVDLRAEPVVVRVPEVEEERYFSIQLSDLYTFIYAYVGSRSTGNHAQTIMIAGPGWEGEAPAGVDHVFHCETEFSIAIFRTQLFGSDDLENVKKLQAGYGLQPLSAFLGQPAPPAAPQIDWPVFDQKRAETDPFFYLDFLLQFCPPVGAAAVERPLRERFFGLGIGAGEPATAGGLSPEFKAAIGEGVKAALAKIEETAANVGVEVNGWRIGSVAGSREFYDGDLALRAAAAKLGIYGAAKEEAVYPFTVNDVTGAPLDGKNTYEMTFAAGELPPVSAFWSITMYDGRTQLLIDNPIDRYLINSAMLDQLQQNPDGSLTIHIQKDSPGEDRASNWLPAPEGPMFVVMRLYWPKTSDPSVYPLGQGSWQPSPLVQVNNPNSEE